MWNKADAALKKKEKKVSSAGLKVIAPGSRQEVHIFLSAAFRRAKKVDERDAS